MKPYRSNTGTIAVIVDNSTFENGITTIWGRQITTYMSNNQEQQKVANLVLTAQSEFQVEPNTTLFVKASVKTAKFNGNNNSEFTVTFYDIIDVIGELAPQATQHTYPVSLNTFTLGGNVGSVEQKNANGNTWYNVSLALTRSFKDNSQNWQDETHWVRLSVSQKTFDMNFKQGLDKGDSLIVETEVSTNDYTDRAGNNITGHEFRVSRVLGAVRKFELQSLKGGQQQQQQQPQQQSQQQGWGQPQQPQQQQQGWGQRQQPQQQPQKSQQQQSQQSWGQPQQQPAQRFADRQRRA